MPNPEERLFPEHSVLKIFTNLLGFSVNFKLICVLFACFTNEYYIEMSATYVSGSLGQTVPTFATYPETNP